jgi:hypothetical protein
MKPVAYINVEERKLEWAEPITWHTPTIAQMDKVPLYIMPNAEPVAWIDPYDLEGLPYRDCWVNGQEHKNSVPLYTHPADLTVEALKTFYEDRLEAGRKREETMMKTIEALLKKAQDK